MSIIPIHVIKSKKDMDAIKDNYCYLLGANGLFLKKSNFVFTSIGAVYGEKATKEARGQVSGLYTIEQKASISVPKLPLTALNPIIHFFIWSADKHSSEAMVYLYYNSTTKKYMAIPPKQTVTGMHIKYGIMPKQPRGYKPVGTIHSHVDMTAFHSGPDDTDQHTFDGIHITIGKVRSGNPEFDVRLYIDKTHYSVKTEHFIEQPIKPKLVFPKIWETAVEKKIEQAITIMDPHVFGYGMGSTFNKNYNAPPYKKTALKKPNVDELLTIIASIKAAPKTTLSKYNANAEVFIKYTPNKNMSIAPIGGNMSYILADSLWKDMSKTNKLNWMFKTIAKINNPT